MIHSDMTKYEKYKNKNFKYFKKVAATGFSLAVVILVLLVFGWDSLQDSARTIFHQNISSRLEKEIDTKFFQMYPEYAAKLAAKREVIMLAQGGTAPDNPEVMIILQTAKQISGASIVYVMNRRGIVVGCSSFDKGKSLTGENYNFRPYFIQAMKGKSTAYPALGVTTNLRGIFFSTPIYARKDHSPIGIVVLKTGLDPIDASLAQINEPVALLSPEGIVFASNRKNWMYHSALPIAGAALAKIRKSRQFSDQALLPLQASLDGNTVKIDGIEYTVRRLPIMIKGWQIGTLASLKVNYAIPTQQLLVFWGGLAILATLSVSTIILLLNSSKRRIVEKELRRTEEKYRSIFENAVEGIIQTTLEGRFLSANPTLATLLGYSTPDELMSTITDIPAQIFVDSSQWGELTRRLRKDKAVSEFEAEFYCKDLSIVVISMNARLVQEADRPAYIDGFLNDISQRKKTEKALLDSEERYRSLFNNISDFVYTHDLEGNILNINRIPAQSLGYTQEELIGTNITDIMPQEHKRDFLAEYLPEIKKNKHRRGKLVLLAENGSEHIISYYNHLVTEEKDIPYVRGSARDITEQISADTERKQLEAQLRHAQKMEAVGTLAGSIAHDFNNVLQVISGYVELLLQNKKVDGTYYKYLQNIELAVRRSTRLIRQLLTTSRKLDSQPEQLDFNDCVTQTCELLRSAIPKMISIEMHLCEYPAYLNADPVQMEQIILNLGTNAKDAMSEGGQLTFTTKLIVLDSDFCRSHPDIVPGSYVNLTVTDTGHGMEDNISEHIFEPFFTTKSKGEGTGLGLATVYGIVNNHSGLITCKSKRGQGTAFDIYLPTLTSAKVQQVVSPEKTLTPRGGQETILLVDDEETILDFGKKAIEHFGYKVVTANTGEEAIEYYEKHKQEPIEMVILDLDMPGMGGRQCLERLLQLNPSLKVLITSGYSDNAQIQEVKSLGAAGFVSKPFPVVNLIAKIRELLDK